MIEVNANCYLERNSEFVMAAKEHGLGYGELIGRIVELARQRWKDRARVKKRRKKRG